MDLFCTLGPASFDGSVIRKLDDLGATLFRINLSHTQLDEIGDLVSLIRSHSDVPVCLDTEGAQIRTGRMREGTIQLTEHRDLHITSDKMQGDASQFSLYPSYAFSLLEVGDLLTIDFNAALIQIASISKQAARIRVITGGQIGSNKAVSVHRPIVLDSLTEKDRGAIKIGCALGIRHYALSFGHLEGSTICRRMMA
jgi:pyruvate kinase